MKQLTHEVLSTLFLQLAHLLHAGLQTSDALDLLAQDTAEPKAKARLEAMVREADQGLPLSAILTDAQFPAYACAMVAAGEQTGRLEEAVFALADYYESRVRLDRQLQAALTQPLALMGVLLVVIVVLLGWVLPVFDQVYRQLGASLTGVAGVLLTLGQGLRAGMPVLLPLALLAVAAVVWLLTSARGKDALLSRSALARADDVRLTQVLSMALRSGLDDTQAMELTLPLAPEKDRFHQQCQTCIEHMLAGHTLPQALSEAGLLPASDCRLLEAGCRGGCADTVMAQLAQRVQERSEARLEARLSRLEPILVLAASLLVGLILLSVLLPLTGIMAAMG